MTEYEITTHPDGKQFIRIEDKWMPLMDVVSNYLATVVYWYRGYDPLPKVDMEKLRSLPNYNKLRIERI